MPSDELFVKKQGFVNDVAQLAFEGRYWAKGYPKNLRVDLPPLDDANTAAFLKRSMALYGGRTAFVSFGESFSFQQIDALSDTFAGFLHRSGLKAGEAVAIMLPNCVQLPVCVLGVLKLGCRVTLVNPMYTERELRYQLKDSEASAIVVFENFSTTLASTIGETHIRQVVVTQLGDFLPKLKGMSMNFMIRHVRKQVPAYTLAKAVSMAKAMKMGKGVQYPPTKDGLDDIAFLQYTGGTTGIPKGAMLSHRNIMSNMQQLLLWTRAGLGTAPICMLTLLPLYHVYALMVNCLLCFALGGRNILIPNPRDMSMVKKAIRGERIDVMTAVNGLFNSLLNNAEFCQRDHSDLKVVLSGGMSLQRAVAQHWFDVTGCPIAEGFGLTEASAVVTAPPFHAGRRPVYSGMVGLPLPGTEVRIRRSDGQWGGIQEIGEVCVRGPQVMLGYWKHPLETQAALDSEGWFATGDLGLMDECGFLKIVDRKKEVIIVSGFNVYPSELEAVIESHPKVKECGVVGVPHRISGEKVKVVVVKRYSSLTEYELIEFCRQHLTAYKVPSFVEFRDELPRSFVGKVLRRELR